MDKIFKEYSVTPRTNLFGDMEEYSFACHRLMIFMDEM
jgi:hypothetical protein